MAQDPYSVLGVSRSASAEDIRKAYRKLAKTYHPDRNQGDAAAEERFKAIGSAFDILGDEEKRRKFDAGEIDADGNERNFMNRGPYGGAGAGPFRQRTRQGPQGGGFDDISDIFSDLFGRSGGGRGRPQPQKGQDLRYRLSVEFMEAARGAKKRVTLPDGRHLDVNVPEGLRDGQTLRLKGRGGEGLHGGPAGDVMVEVSVKPHPIFRLEGDDLNLDLPVTLKEAVLGAKVEVPNITGNVAIKLPPNTSSGKVFRLRGKGIKHPKTASYGDLYARIKIVLPEQPDPELQAFATHWRGEEGNPRDDLPID